MTHLVVMLYPRDTIPEAAKRLARNRISGAPVVEGGKVVGMISESDLIRRGKTVADVMSRFVIHVSPDAGVSEAADIIERRGVKRLSVVDDEGYLLGIIARADIVRAIAGSGGTVSSSRSGGRPAGLATG